MASPKKNGITAACARAALFLVLAAALIFPALSNAAELETVKVRRVVDGDTIEIAYQGRKERLRFIGVNTPETKHPTKGVQPYGPEASDYTKKALTGRQVWLEFDVGLRDQYGRLLAYIWVEKPEGRIDDAQIRGKMFNASLLLDGYAQQVTFPPNVRYVDFFSVYQTEARNASRGLWGLETERRGSKTEAKENTPAPISESGYVGNRDSLVFHRASCDGARTMNAKNRVSIEDREKAVEEGFKPCPICKP
jgi:micrococcal nuclease